MEMYHEDSTIMYRLCTLHLGTDAIVTVVGAIIVNVKTFLSCFDMFGGLVTRNN